MTRDIDIAVAGTDLTSAALADELELAGIVSRIAHAVAFADENEVLLMKHLERLRGRAFRTSCNVVDF